MGNCSIVTLKKILENPLKLRRLADKWFEMTVTLRKEGIAHGDLQHGNIFVFDDEIKLIDYDGMFVPRLAGRQSNERGLEHYQHPKRDDSHFGRYLDNFSNWVIYTTLYALSVDPTLWRFANLPDKHLIFQKKDYEEFNASPTFQALKAHEDGTIRTYATTIENLLLYDVPRIPDFNPDKPVLYPPQKPAVNVQTQRADRGDQGKGADRGSLPDGGGDRGRMFEQDTGDRGRMFEDRGDRGDLAEKEAGTNVQVAKDGKAATKKSPPVVLITSIAAAVLVTPLAIWGGLTFTKTQATAASRAQLREGIIAQQGGSFDQAQKEYQSVVDDTNSEKSLRTTAKCMLELSRLQKRGAKATLEDIRATEQAIEAVLKDDPHNTNARYALGKLYEQSNDAAKARQQYNLGLEDNKNDRDLSEAIKGLK